jgi:hypothetical protein
MVDRRVEPSLRADRHLIVRIVLGEINSKVTCRVSIHDVVLFFLENCFTCILKAQVSVIVIYRSIGSLVLSFALCLRLTRLDDIETETTDVRYCSHFQGSVIHIISATIIMINTCKRNLYRIYEDYGSWVLGTKSP